MSARSDRTLIRMAALSAAVAIAAGAFASHGITGRPAELLRTGAFYQLIHAVAVIALGNRCRAAAPALLLAGSVVFAVTLYGLAFDAPRWLGAVTPIGGVAMIAGWLWLAVARRT